tara:strand:- start:2753 stop:3601 length:849 start_codon:yes stop_codon:yes gene_type:complete
LKVALCYSGHVGRFWDVYENHKQAFIKNNQVDIFIHTSDAVSQKRNLKPHIPPRDEIVIDYLPGHVGWRKMLGTYGKIYNVEIDKLEKKINKVYGEQLKKLVIESEDINEDNNEIEKITKWEWLKKRQLYKMHACNNLMREYEKENNIEYDLVIRSRFDSTFKTFIDIEKTAALVGDLENKIFVFGGWKCPEGNRFMDNFLFDGFSMGAPSSMDVYCSLYEKEKAYPPIEKYKQYQKDWGDNVEYQLDKHLRENNIEILYLNDPTKQLNSPGCGRWLYDVYR